MKKSLPVLVFVLAISTAFALAQSNMGSSAPGQNNAAQNNAAQNGSMPAANQPQAAPSASTDSSAASAAPQVDDQTIQRQVHEQLATNPDMQNIRVSVDKGDVSLAGTVPSKGEKKEAKKLAQSVPGVKKVKDSLTVASNAKAGSSSVGAPSSTNSTTGANGSEASPSSSGTGTMNENPPTTPNPNNTPSTSPSTPPQSHFLRASFMGEQAGQNGSATTSDGAGSSQNSGATPSATPSNPSAESSGVNPGPTGSQANSASGQSNSTGSSPAVGEPAGQSGSMNSAGESPDQVKNDIQTAFKNEPTLTSSNVSVDVSADSVTLSGSVPSEKDRDEARRIAQSFSGSRKVVDNVKVSGTGTSSSPDISSSPNTNPNTGMQTNQANPEQPSVPKK